MAGRVGFIGLGRMGRPMATNLLRKDFEVLVHDIDPNAVAALAGLGARTAASVAELARARDRGGKELAASPDALCGSCGATPVSFGPGRNRF